MQLYQRICEYENLYNAFHCARRGKRKQESVARFERDLEIELFRLQDELLSKTYRPSRYRSFYLTDSKRRLISAAPFRDRVVHHALVDTIEPLFERRFIFDSYANRKGKGTHRALDRCTQFLRNSRYALQCDIRQFFPSIDHALLRSELSRVIGDEGTLWLCDRILETGMGVLDEEYEMRWFAGDDLLAINRPRSR
ncbi:MAG: Retron-type reverse transcriptase [Chloroflexi bacterium]|nr:Retron-type reverse transcriptase [Chloroflexota bacterium]